MPQTVTIFSDANYKGKKKSFYEGDFDTGYLGIGNDKLSSLQVTSGMKVTLYKDSGWTGSSATYQANAASVGNLGDKTSSIKVRHLIPINVPAIKVYQDKNFKKSWELLEPGEYPTPDTYALGNDSISSVRIPEGLLAILFEHVNYGGRVLGLISDASDLGKASFNDKTSSIKILKEADYLHVLQKPGSDRSPGPLPKMTGFEQPRDSTTPVLVGETLLPFMVVKEDYEPILQADVTPYYILRRECCWKLSAYLLHNSPTEETSTLTVKVGVSERDSKTITETLHFDVSVSDKLLGIVLNAKISKDLSVQTLEEITVTTEKTSTYSVTFPAGTPKCAVAIYQHVDLYTLKRLDGVVISTWEVRSERTGQATWPVHINVALHRV